MAVLSLTELCKRYVALLASQYQQPNAQQQMALWTKQFLADNFIQRVLAAYNFPGAQGTQLDVIGKYIGVTRFQTASAHPPFFGYFPGGFESVHAPANYKGTWNPATNTPTLANGTGTNGWWYAVQVAGTSTSPISNTFLQGDIIWYNGTVWAKDANYNANGYNNPAGTANVGAIYDTPFFANAPAEALSDSAYLQLLYLQIIRNASNGTLPDVIARLQFYFGTAIALVDNLNMTVTYTVTQSVVLLSKDTLTQFLPRPAGVGIVVNLV